MAHYRVKGVYLKSPVQGEVVGDLITDLATAKALAQVNADRLRVSEHRRKAPLSWDRRHSDKETTWVGSIGFKPYVVLANGERTFVRY